MKRWLLLLVTAGLFLLPPNLAKCDPSDFSIAIVPASQYDPNVTLPWGVQANFTNNSDFNNTKIYAFVKTNCSCNATGGLRLYNEKLYNNKKWINSTHL